MKEKYKIIAILLLGCITTYAQPVLNSTDFTSDSYTYEIYGSADVSGLSPGNPGADQVWNFSSVALTLSGTSSVVSVASSPYAASFPTANYCLKSTPAGIPGSIYQYSKISSTSYENLGNASIIGVNIYSDTSVLFQFPYTYNTEFYDTYQTQGQSQVKGTTITYDGYGTVVTPYGIFTNVIRQKSIDSNSGKTSYAWFQSNPFKLIMNWNSSDNGITGKINVVKSTSLGVNKINTDKTVQIYPNPTNSLLSLRLPNSLIVDRVVITDLAGKTVLQQNQNTNEINVQTLTSGLYMLQVFSGEEKFQSKFVKE